VVALTSLVQAIKLSKHIERLPLQFNQSKMLDNAFQRVGVAFALSFDNIPKLFLFLILCYILRRVLALSIVYYNRPVSLLKPEGGSVFLLLELANFPTTETYSAPSNPLRNLQMVAEP
jgi:hypothetical protein